MTSCEFILFILILPHKLKVVVVMGIVLGGILT